MQNKDVIECLRLLVALILCGVSFRAFSLDVALMKVTLNQEEKGDYIFLLAEDGAPLFQPEHLLEMGFRQPLPGGTMVYKGSSYLSLDALPGKVETRVDQKSSSLYITAAPSLLEMSSIDLNQSHMPEAYYPDNNSLFLNYKLDYQLDDEFNYRSMNAPLELGVNLGSYLLESEYLYQERDQVSSTTRKKVSVTRDVPAAQQRYVFGDISARSGSLGGRASLGGISLSKEFSLAPDMESYSTMYISGALEAPADVELYVNERLVRREHLSAGEFEFRNITGAGGPAYIAVFVREITGKEYWIYDESFISRTLLKPGLHQYSYNLGLQRKNDASFDDEYDEWTFIGYHKVGVNEFYTTTLAWEVDEDVVNLESENQFVVMNTAEVDLMLAASESDSLTGGSGNLGLRYSGDRYSLGFLGRRNSRHYSHLNLAPDQDRPRYQFSASAGVHSKRLGSLTLSASKNESYEGSETLTSSLGYSRSLARGLTFSARARRNKINDQWMNDYFFGVNYSLGSGRSLSVTQNNSETTDRTSFRYSKNEPQGEGHGYNINLYNAETSGAPDSTGGSGSLRYKSSTNIYSASVNNVNDTNSYRLGMEGGMAIVDWNMYLSRPIRDSFAVIKVGDLEGVKVKRGGQLVGETNHNGEVLVSELISYSPNKITLDENDIPINYSIGSVSKFIATTLRRGGLVEWDIKKRQAFIAKVVIVEDGETSPATYWGMEMDIKGEKEEYIIGKKGKMYIEDVPVGTWPSRVFLNDKSCFVDIEIVDSNDAMVDLGVIRCEMD